MVTTYSISVWGDDKVLEVRGAYTIGLHTCKWFKWQILCYVYFTIIKGNMVKMVNFILGILSHGFLFLFFSFLKVDTYALMWKDF